MPFACLVALAASPILSQLSQVHSGCPTPECRDVPSQFQGGRGTPSGAAANRLNNDYASPVSGVNVPTGGGGLPLAAAVLGGAFDTFNTGHAGKKSPVAS